MDLITGRPSAARRRRSRSVSPVNRHPSGRHLRRQPIEEPLPLLVERILRQSHLHLPSTSEVHLTQHERPASVTDFRRIATPQLPAPPENRQSYSEFSFPVQKVQAPLPRVMISRPGENTTFDDVYRWLRVVMACSVGHAISGLVAIGVAGALVPLRLEALHFHCGFWCGAIFLLTAVLDMYAAWRSSRRLLSYSFLCSIVTCFLAIIEIGIASHAIVCIHKQPPKPTYSDLGNYPSTSPLSQAMYTSAAQALPLFAVFCAIGLFEAATSVVNIALTKMVIHVRIYNFDR